MGAGPFALDDVYQSASRAEPAQRVALAGIRLANLLNEALQYVTEERDILYVASPGDKGNQLFGNSDSWRRAGNAPHRTQSIGHQAGMATSAM
jgi:hypothetical protein